MNVGLQDPLEVLIVPHLFYSVPFLLSSVPLLPLMHKIARCSVNSFPVQISFFFVFISFHIYKS